MAGCVFAASDVEVDAAPVLVGLARYEGLVVVRVHISQVVCRRTCEAWHSVKFQGVAFGCDPVLGAPQRRLAGFRGEVFVDFGQLEREIFVGCRNAVDIAYGYRLAPVTLAAEYGVAQTVVCLHASYSFFFDKSLGGGDGLFHGHTVEIQLGAFGVYHRAFFGVEAFLAHIGSLDKRYYGQVEVAGKGVVAAVVGRNGHNGARAVACQNVVADVYGYLFA